MGDIAESIVRGETCEICCEPLASHHPAGYPRRCASCAELDEPTRRSGGEGGERVADAAREFEEACTLARAAGLELRRCTPLHYQLRGPGAPLGWLLNLYPSNRRIYADKHRPRAPYLGLPTGVWGLLAVVRAAIERQKGGSSDGRRKASH